MCSMFLFSVRIINVKLNKLPVMEVINDLRASSGQTFDTNFWVLQRLCCTCEILT